MDNKASAYLNQTMKTKNIKYQLFLPSNHRTNNAERVLQNVKNHFIAVLCSLDKYFHLRSWDRLLQKATISINLLKQARTLPLISSYTPISGEFYFNRTPLDPPGTRVVMNNRTNNCASWEPYGEGGWYIVPAMEHYRHHK